MIRAGVLALMLAAVVAGCGRKGDIAAPTPEAADAQREVQNARKL